MKGKVRVFVVPAGPDLVKAVLVERLVVVRLCENPRSGDNCIKIGLPGKLILSKRKGLREVLFS